MLERSIVYIPSSLATGTYILQTNRASFNQNKVDPTCMLCKNGKESLQHLLLDCSVLSSIRNPIMISILEACSSLYNPACDTDTLLKLSIDCSALIYTNIHNHELSMPRNTSTKVLKVQYKESYTA